MHCKNTAFNPVTAQIKPCSFFQDLITTAALGKAFPEKVSGINPFN